MDWRLLAALFSLVFGFTAMGSSTPSSLGAAGFPSYNPDTYPDSLRAYNLGQVRQPGLLCDPNGILKGSSLASILGVLDAIRVGTKCPCDDDESDEDGQGEEEGMSVEVESLLSNAAVDEPTVPGATASPKSSLGRPEAASKVALSTMGKCGRDGRDGFTVSIAVLNKVQVENVGDEGGASDAAVVKVFADALRNRLGRGQCEEDVLVVLSVGDRKVATSLGSKAALKLNQSFIDEVTNEAWTYHFAHDRFFDGLLYIARRYGAQLGATGTNFPSTSPTPSRSTQSGTLPGVEAWLDAHLFTHLPAWLGESEWRSWLLGAVAVVLAVVVVGFCSAGACLVRAGWRRLTVRSARYSPARPPLLLGHEYAYQREQGRGRRSGYKEEAE